MRKIAIKKIKELGMPAGSVICRGTITIYKFCLINHIRRVLRDFCVIPKKKETSAIESSSNFCMTRINKSWSLHLKWHPIDQTKSLQYA